MLKTTIGFNNIKKENSPGERNYARSNSPTERAHF
jgi:hypothetical protein